MVLSILIAGGYALFAVAALVELVWGYARLAKLVEVAPITSHAPRVSIVVAARDEARHVESAVRSLLRLDYPDYELIVVNDRSTDGTGEILRKVAATEGRLQVVDVTDLPAGWLGKNHALHVGAANASGTVLLFADADVIFEPDALLRAVGLLERERADHVTVAPQLILPSLPLTHFVNYLFLWGFLALRPWKTSDPKSRAYAGIGAFNLVRRSAYDAIGGFTRIQLRPDDDLMLGKLLKRSGFRQLVADGMGQLQIEWYRTFGEAARGFRKNTFAVLNYNAAFGVAAVVSNLAAVWPFAAPFVTDGATRVLYGITAVAFVAAYARHATMARTRPWLAPLYPIAALMSAWVIGSVVARTLWTRRIDWRGTSYSLDELRANRV
jgi:glycosyltransferase involved in cell wall biosynthesis